MTVKNCTKCRLHKTRNKIVWGRGPIDATVKFVGEAPGEQEDKKGKPFVGRSGTLLNGILLDIGGTEIFSKVFITNMIMCRPPKNRDPRPDEIEACGRWLRYKLVAYKPKVVVCLGKVASDHLIGDDWEWNGSYTKKGILYIPIYHPSYVIRNGSEGPILKQFRRGVYRALKKGKLL